MQIVKLGPVLIEPPHRIPREHITAMIANGLDGRRGAEQHALPWAQPRDLACQHETQDVEEEGFEPVGVDGAVGVGDVDAVMLGVYEAVEGAVHVAEAVGEVDPGVDHDEREEVLKEWCEDCDGEFGDGEFEISEIVVAAVEGVSAVGDGLVFAANDVCEGSA